MNLQEAVIRLDKDLSELQLKSKDEIKLKRAGYTKIYQVLRDFLKKPSPLDNRGFGQKAMTRIDESLASFAENAWRDL